MLDMERPTGVDTCAGGICRQWVWRFVRELETGPTTGAMMSRDIDLDGT